MKTKTPNLYNLLTCKCKMTKERRFKRQRAVAIIIIFAVMIAAGIIGHFEQRAIAYYEPASILIPEKEQKQEQAVLKLYSKEEAINRIREIAAERSFKWPDYLIRLIDCESSFNQFAINKKTTATGWLQIVDNHKLTRQERYDLDFSVNWAMDKIEAGKQGMWECDKIIKNNKNQTYEKNNN